MTHTSMTRKELQTALKLLRGQFRLSCKLTAKTEVLRDEYVRISNKKTAQYEKEMAYHRSCINTVEENYEGAFQDMFADAENTVNSPTTLNTVLAVVTLNKPYRVTRTRRTRSNLSVIKQLYRR